MTAKTNLMSGNRAEAAQDARRALLEIMMVSREADIREDILFRQGRGQFHVSSSGHEPMAALASLMRGDDLIFSYYRDRALLLARGMPLRDMALGFFAKAGSCSGGRQMVSHFSDAALNVQPSSTPTGLQCLPAAGAAWGLKRAGNGGAAFCCIGDASTRQGEFFEALAFAIQEALPVVFMVEDNGYGISTPTEGMTPLSLGMIPPGVLHVLDGRDAFALGALAAPVVERTRAGGGPSVLWIKFDRLTSHTASDDQTKYRDIAELSAMKQRDPLNIARRQLAAEGIADLDETAERIRADVKRIYQEAERAADPQPGQAAENVLSTPALPARSHNRGAGEGTWTMAGAINRTLKDLMKENSRALTFGQDIEDPKGGVFGLTKGLSTLYPGRVVNAPLAEATIAGLAAGLPAAGFLPIFELQFIDFMGPAFHQLVNNIATIRWRSNGAFKCPAVIYAPCGGYVGGGPWHSQTGESWLAHAPGLKVFMPGNANDAAHLLHAAAHGEDPAILLLPKNQFQTAVPCEAETRLYPERARLRREGGHISLIAWGNCVELAMQAAERLGREGVGADVLDLCSLVPCDWQALHASVRKTGRLVVIQEDNRTCSFGQSIISGICGDKATWERLYAPPQLVSRADAHIGFSRVLEGAILPNVEKILQAVHVTLGQADD